MIDFRSDNTGRAAPEILDALIRANSGTALGYGADEWTARLQERFSELFETKVRVFPVATGTAANALSLAAIAPSWGLVFCSAAAHINTSEANAAGFFGGGLKLAPVAGEHGKVDAAALAQAVDRISAWPAASRPAGRGQLDPGDRSRRGLPARRGARGGRNCQGARPHDAYGRRTLRQRAGAAAMRSPAELSWRSGIDILSFGATKNGGALCDAIVVFTPEIADGLAVQLRRAGQVWSKMRFASAQLMAYIENGLWLRLATASNRAAARIAAGIEGVAGAEAAGAGRGQRDLPRIAGRGRWTRSRPTGSSSIGAARRSPVSSAGST